MVLQSIIGTPLFVNRYNVNFTIVMLLVHVDTTVAAAGLCTAMFTPLIFYVLRLLDGITKTEIYKFNVS